MTINEAIRRAADNLARSGISSARLDAELLLSHILQKDRTWIFTHIHEFLETSKEKMFQDLIVRRTGREPLQYIIGIQEFWGLEFRVTPDVLIPRPETELVVEAAIEILKKHASQPVVIDLCTGSGCIAVSIAKALCPARIFAADKSERALSIARDNAGKHGVADRIRFLEGDLLEPFAALDLQEQADLITANPPYIPSTDLPGLQPEVREFEPEMALIAGEEGTEIHQRIIAEAPRYLKPNGSLIMEMGVGQSEALKRMVNDTGFYFKASILKDLAGIDRVILVKRNDRACRQREHR